MQWQIPTAFGESALGGISESIELLNARAAERHVVHAYAKVAELKSTRVGQMQSHTYICQSTRVADWHICQSGRVGQLAHMPVPLAHATGGS